MWSAGSSSGKSPRTLFSPPPPLEALAATVAFQGETRCLAGARSFWSEVRIAPLEIEGQQVALGTVADGTERRREENALKESEQRLRHQAVQLSVSQVVSRDVGLEEAAPRILEALLVNLEWDAGAILVVDSRARALMTVAARESAAPDGLLVEGGRSLLPLEEGLAGQVFATGEAVSITDLRAEGRTDPLLSGRSRGALAVPIRSRQGTAGVLVLAGRKPYVGDVEILGVVSSIGTQLGLFLERRTSEEALKVSEERYRLLFERNLAGVYRKSVRGIILACNDAFVRILGYSSKKELLDRSFIDLYVSPEEREMFLERLQAEKSLTNYEIRLKRADGQMIWSLQNVTFVEGESQPAYVEGSLIDITDRKAAQDSLVRLAYHDVLTGLPNRALFFDRVKQAITLAQRYGLGLAVLFVDLDGFKDFNDHFGHDVGDAVLRSSAGRLRGAVREGDMVARLGGDEFAVLLPKGKNRAEVFEIEPVLARPAGDRRLADAVALNEFVLHFEPELDLLSGDVTGLEALMRWRHPGAAVVPLREFLPLAEETKRSSRSAPGLSGRSPATPSRSGRRLPASRSRSSSRAASSRRASSSGSWTASCRRPESTHGPSFWSSPRRASSSSVPRAGLSSETSPSAASASASTRSGPGVSTRS